MSIRAFLAALALSIGLSGCEAGPDAPDRGNPGTLPELAMGSQTSAFSFAGIQPQATIAFQAAPAVRMPEVSTSCSDSEDVLFSCRFDSGKQLSVCADDKDKTHYRFGKETPEMALIGTSWASVPYSGGGEAQIKFTNGDTDYIVFSRVIRTNFTPDEPNNPEFSDGVMVVRKGKLLSKMSCNGDDLVPINYSKAETLLSRSEDLYFYD